MQGQTQTHPQCKKLAPLTTRSSNLRCISAAEHQTAEQYSKTGKTKPLKHLPRSYLYLSWNTCQDFLKIPNRWEAALETERRCFSKVILESNITHNITRSSDFFSTVPPIVNAGDWGCIVRDLETMWSLLRVCFFESNVHCRASLSIKVHLSLINFSTQRNYSWASFQE